MEAFGNFVIGVLLIVIFILVAAWIVLLALAPLGVALGYWQIVQLLAVGRLVAYILFANLEVK